MMRAAAGFDDNRLCVELEQIIICSNNVTLRKKIYYQSFDAIWRLMQLFAENS